MKSIFTVLMSLAAFTANADLYSYKDTALDCTRYMLTNRNAEGHLVPRPPDGAVFVNADRTSSLYFSGLRIDFDKRSIAFTIVAAIRLTRDRVQTSAWVSETSRLYPTVLQNINAGHHFGDPGYREVCITGQGELLDLK